MANPDTPRSPAPALSTVSRRDVLKGMAGELKRLQENQAQLADATDKGYVFQPSQARLMPKSGKTESAVGKRAKHA